MKKVILFILSLFSISYILHSSFVLAAPQSNEIFDQFNAAAGPSGANIVGSGPRHPGEVAARLIRTALGVIGIIFVVLIVYAGFLWMTAAGEEEKTGKAKKLITSGVIGLLIILSARALTSFVISKLTTATTGSGQFDSGQNLPAPPIQ